MSGDRSIVIGWYVESGRPIHFRVKGGGEEGNEGAEAVRGKEEEGGGVVDM